VKRGQDLADNKLGTENALFLGRKSTKPRQICIHWDSGWKPRHENNMV